ncbi:MAG: AMP-binding protein [Rhodoferax sp.]|nr:AMP-binding protein [Rhodoferax sp.]
MHASFQWLVPAQFNIAQVCCARWAARPGAAKRIAIRTMGTLGKSTFYTYFELQQQASRLSHVLTALGVVRGDRVAIVMPQRFETAVAYMAVLQMGAVAMPLSMLFGPEALEYRLQDSEAVLAICDESSIASIGSVREHCPHLRSVLGVGGAADQADTNYAGALASVSSEFAPVVTQADDAAILIYTSGTTGNPKGALIPHRALIGNLTGFVCSQNWFGFDGKRNATTDAVFWSPADWAWTGGLMDALLPTLYFGRPIVAFNGRFSPEVAMELMSTCGVTHTFLFPTALKAMMKAYPGAPGVTVHQQFKLKLQAIMSAGEAVGDAVFEYCQQQLGVTVNEMFGQTEINYIVGNCARQWPAKPGSMGKGYPGHRVAVIDDAGNECAEGVPGDVAVNRFDVHGQPDPIFFLGYWKNEASTRAKYTGDWCRTGDLASRDADGYLWYQGRSDDVFKAAGYRIGPGEIENCLVKHPAVANAAVVPKPDRARGAVVKAYVVIAPDFVAYRAMDTRGFDQFDAELVAELQAHVKGKLAPYEYPKEIEFVEALPMTTTGKVQRRVLRLQEEERAKLQP